MAPTSTPRIAFTTLGCKVNQSETDLLARQFAAAGYLRVAFDQPAEVYVVNTCTVTHVADRKSRHLIHRARRLNPEALVVATGCFASTFGGELADEHTLVIRNREKGHILPLVDGRLKRTTPPDVSTVDLEKYGDLLPGHDRSRAMVKVQDGCDSHCAYCIIPRARGRSRSLAPQDVTDRIEQLVREGHAEIVITGVDLGSYGQENDAFPDLGGLLRRILDSTHVARIRVSSLEPGDFDASWLPLWRDPRLCRHLHVPLQSGSGAVLTRMKRSYTPDQFEQMVVRCRKEIPGVAITTDVMCGFPGESEGEFDEGLEFIRRISFDGMHVFKYSLRSGTPAVRLPGQVREEVKDRRSRILRAEGAAGAERLLDRHRGSYAAVVWEGAKDGLCRGVTDTNVRVYATPPVATGRVERVRLGAAFLDGLWAEDAQSEISLIPVS